MRGGGILWRALNAARRANLAEAGEPAPLPAPGGIARRALLKAMAASAGAAAMPAAALGLKRGARVAILGGGLAGLVALDKLVAAGIDATLYEARSRVGGRVHTVGGDGAPLFERGGQLVNTDHADMRALAERFGIALVDRKATPHQTMVMAGGKVMSEAALVTALRPIARQINADAALLDADWERHVRRFDRLSIAGYLDRHAALIADPWARRLLESVARTEYGVEPGRASAVELLFALPTVNGERFEVLGGSDERFLITGGSSALPLAMAARHADRIRLRRRAVSIAGALDGALGIGFAEGDPVTADRVIVALPAALVRTIRFDVRLPSAWRDWIAALELGRNEKVQLATGDKPWAASPLGTGGEAWVTDADAEAVLGWDASVIRDGASPGVWNWFMGGDQVGSPAVSALARRFAPAAMLPDALLDRPVDRTAWHRDPHSMGAYVNCPPGFLSRHWSRFWVESDKPDERQACAIGRISFAGEHTSDAFPGYMNGAAQTGRLAAEALIAAA